MKRWRRRFVIFFLLLFCVSQETVSGAELRLEGEASENYTDMWQEELDFSGLDELLETELFPGEREPIRFSTVVQALLDEGIDGFDYGMIITWLKDSFFYEMQANKKSLLEIVVLAMAFSILKNFSGAFKQGYISDVSFFMVYGILSVLLMQSFRVCGNVVQEALTQSVDFMKMLVPTFCISMVFSTGVGTSAGFYQIAFLVIYIIQWLFLKVFMPLIEAYMLLVLFNHFFEDNKFENLSELIKGFVNWGLKTAGVVVIGLNVVQGLIAPAKDRIATGAVHKAATFIPGVGGVMNGIGEMLLGSGLLLKNCVGVAALILMVAIAMVPILKILGISLFYKLAAVAVEPVADKRISGCLKGIAETGILYLKLVIYAVALFFLTIALTTASSSMGV